MGLFDWCLLVFLTFNKGSFCFASLVDNGVRQPSALTWLHLLQPEQWVMCKQDDVLDPIYHGGTNFGRTVGGPFIATSFDYDALIDEYGLLREPKWGHLRDLNRAIKLCEPALVFGESSVMSLGRYQEDSLALIDKEENMEADYWIPLGQGEGVASGSISNGFGQVKLKSGCLDVGFILWVLKALGALGGTVAILEVIPLKYKHMIGGPSLKVDLHTGAIAEGILTFVISVAVLFIILRGSNSPILKTIMLSIGMVALVVAGSSYTGPSMNLANVSSLFLPFLVNLCIVLCMYLVRFPSDDAHTGPVHCGKPILKATAPSFCFVHFQKAQKHVARALKKAGLHIPSSSKPAPKQRGKLREKLDKCVKDKLLDFYDLLDILVAKSTMKKEKLSVKLLEFLESPHATTKVSLANKEQVQKTTKCMRKAPSAITEVTKVKKEKGDAKKSQENKSSSSKDNLSKPTGKKRVLDVGKRVNEACILIKLQHVNILWDGHDFKMERNRVRLNPIENRSLAWIVRMYGLDHIVQVIQGSLSGLPWSVDHSGLGEVTFDDQLADLDIFINSLFLSDMSNSIDPRLFSSRLFQLEELGRRFNDLQVSRLGGKEKCGILTDGAKNIGEDYPPKKHAITLSCLVEKKCGALDFRVLFVVIWIWMDL
ncbi:hypothetical protein GIB67_018952 [Kingdonia uniflora]|uniref:beta-galactosidase n=1 Tax=Kingdonia uniflora TaxID=39325 RepID=A0A7J7L2U8_9MAGN|nr:hypothetical protein GIB67_018952 [Kingdonia uniflora]